MVGNQRQTSLGGPANYVDPFSRLEAQTHDTVQIRGATTKKPEQADDDMIVVNHRAAKVKLDESKQGSIRAPSQETVSVQPRQSLTESQVLNAITDIVMQEMSGADASSQKDDLVN